MQKKNIVVGGGGGVQKKSKFNLALFLSSVSCKLFPLIEYGGGEGLVRLHRTVPTMELFVKTLSKQGECRKYCRLLSP